MATAAEYATWIVQNKDKQGTPEFETVAEAYQIAKRSQNLAATEEQIRPKQSESGVMSQLVGAGETALTLGTGLTSGLVGTIGGSLSEMLQQAMAGKFGTPEAARAIEQRAAAGAERYTYMPRTEAGMEQVQAIGKVAGMLPPVLPGALDVGMLSGAIRQAAPIAETTALRGLQAVTRGAQETAQAAQRGKGIVQEALGMGAPSSTGVGGRVGAGSAATPAELQRMTTAQSLPVPVELTKGAASREAQQLSFEKEQIKGPLGAPLRQRAEENSLQALANFDALIEMTGAELASGLPAATGNVVIDALSKGLAGAKFKTSAAFKKAESAGELQAPVQMNALADYINLNQPESTVAPVLNVAKSKGLQLGIFQQLEDGTITALPADLKNTELLRRSINNTIGIDPTNIKFGSELKKVIDTSTEGVGGDLYKEARALRQQQARKYEGRAIVANLITKVKGKDDPKVAASDAFQKSILNATPEEVTFLRRVLLTSGKDGQKAMKELQGATLKYLENEAKSGLQTDSMDRPVITASKLNNAVTALDDDGRLDIILGKQKAQTVRDLNEVVKYVNTVPPGTLINNSGTAMTLMATVGAITEAGLLASFTGLPLPVLTTIKAATQQIRNNKTKARINEALNKAQPNLMP